jgi:hypothetical protein
MKATFGCGAGDIAHEQHRERRQQSPRTAVVEARERDPAGGGALLEQQRRDQEARQDEEEIHSRASAAMRNVPVMPADDEQDCYPAQAVERRHVAQPLPSGLVHSRSFHEPLRRARRSKVQSPQSRLLRRLLLVATTHPHCAVARQQ